jgi:rhamnose transport system permease protein
MSERHQREYAVAGAVMFLLLLLAIVRPSFYQGDYLRALAVGTAPVLIAACGMTLVIVARQIDISVGAQFSLCGVLAGLAAQAGWPMGTVVLVAIGSGAVLGLVNGWLVGLLRLPAIVVTLGTAVLWKDVLNWGRQGEAVRDLPGTFQWFGWGQEAGQWLLLGIALAVWLFFAWALRSLAWGRMIYAVGSDVEAARLAGIRPPRVVLGVFVCLGALTGLAAVVNCVCYPQVDAKAGDGLELKVIAAVVIGGTAISGGRGTLVGTLLGVLLLRLVGPTLVFLGIEPQWEKALQGLIILLAVALDSFSRRKT